MDAADEASDQPVDANRRDGRGSRASRRRAQVRERLLDVAEQAFLSGTYRDVRMEDLAEAVDVSVGTLYGHFGSKDGLYLALGERALEAFAAYLRAAYRPEYTPLEQVLACGDLYLRFHLEHPGLFRLISAGVADIPAIQSAGELPGRVQRPLGEILGGFEECIASAIAAGEIHSSYDPRIVARFLWGAWNGVVALNLRNDTMALTDTELSDCIYLGRRIVSDGLTAPAFRDDQGRSRARLVDTRDRAAS